MRVRLYARIVHRLNHRLYTRVVQRVRAHTQHIRCFHNYVSMRRALRVRACASRVRVFVRSFVLCFS